LSCLTVLHVIASIAPFEVFHGIILTVVVFVIDLRLSFPSVKKCFGHKSVDIFHAISRVLKERYRQVTVLQFHWFSQLS